MPNTAFDPVRLSGQILRALRMSLVTDSLVNRNYQGEIEGPEDSVDILTLGALTVNDYDPATGITVETEPSALTDQLQITHKKYFAFIADMADNAAEYANLFQEEGTQDLLKLAQQFVLGKYSDATHQVDFDDTAAESTPTERSTKQSNFRAAVKEGAETLDNAEVPDEGRWLALRPQEVRLIEDDIINRDTNLGDSVIQNGYQGMYRGFEVYKAPDSHFTNTGSSPSYDHSMMGHRIAITYADAILNTRVQESERYFGQQVDGLHVAGAEVVRPDALVDFRIQVA
jgi:hypothetical protein